MWDSPCRAGSVSSISSNSRSEEAEVEIENCGYRGMTTSLVMPSALICSAQAVSCRAARLRGQGWLGMGGLSHLAPLQVQTTGYTRQHILQVILRSTKALDDCAPRSRKACT